MSFLLVRAATRGRQLHSDYCSALAQESMDRGSMAALDRRGPDGERDDVMSLLRRLRARVGGDGAGARGGHVRSVARAYERLLTHVRPAFV